ncbi:MAG: glycosyl hydrolase family 18 protein [Clostridium sp.]|uniref:glycosyl hydrolase family 18 protein n=1 Tax=Clostridium sp. TaxID=1506 RepID=UPI00304203F3
MKGIKLKKVLAALLVSAYAVTTFAIPASAIVTTGSKSPDLERKIVGYFPEWAYESEVQGFFDVADLQWDSLTHIQYSFAMVGPDHKIAFGDKKAAIEEDFSKHKLEHNGKEVKLDPKLPYKGHFNVMQQMKKQYPDVKLLISVGGWTGSRGFYEMMDTDAGINTFADSCVDFIRTYGFDGVDIDFEYPTATATAGNPADKDLSEPRRGILNARYNVLIKTLREKIDAAGKQDNKDYLVTAAVTASAWVLGGVYDNTYASYLDFLSVMSYDFHGGWNEYVENLANIYPDKNDTETTGMAMPTLNMDWAYRFYRGVLPPEKILMGIPYYTRGWENVQGGNGSGLHGKSKTPASGDYNLWGDDDDKDGKPDPAGANPLWHVLNLMEEDPNFKVYWDDAGKVPYVWQSDKKVFLSFENEKSIDERVKYIEDKNLGGALIWVMNGDYGPNPNYVKGSKDPNKGKYTWGDTLTSRLSNGLEKMGNCSPTDDNLPGDLDVSEGNISIDYKYDHPNGEAKISVTGKDGKAFPKGWELQFDMPKSAIFTSVENGTFEVIKETDEFVRVKVKSSMWSEHVVVKAKLCYSGLRNIRINGKVPANMPIDGNYLPELKGATDKVVVEGSSFDVRAGVTASDIEDGVLTSSIRVNGGVDTKKVGTHKVEYIVKDSDGAEIKRSCNVYVIPKEHSDAVIWDAGTQYSNGNKVVYNGKIYRVDGWWTPVGSVPGENASFKVIADLPLQDGGTTPDPILTLAEVAAKYNKAKGQTGYDVKCDLNNDGIIDLFDLVIVAKKM